MEVNACGKIQEYEEQDSKYYIYIPQGVLENIYTLYSWDLPNDFSSWRLQVTALADPQ